MTRALFALALVACTGDDKTTGDSGTPPEPNATGLWTGPCGGQVGDTSTTTTPLDLTFDTTLDLTEDDAGVIIGAWSFDATVVQGTKTGTGSSGTGTVTGSRDGDNVQLDITDIATTQASTTTDPPTVTFDLTLDGDDATGSFSVQNGDFGYVLECALSR